MIQPSYILKRLKTSNYSELFKVTARVAKITHKPRIAVMKDLLGCIAKHETGYRDYEVYKLYAMDEAGRSRFLSVGRNNKLVKELNDPEQSRLIDDKIEFNKRYAKFLKREWMQIDGNNKAEFLKFCEGKDAIIAKPVDESGGKGVTKIYVNQEKNLEETYDRLFANKITLIEEVAVQVSEMDVLCTTAVNTIRLITLTKDNGEPVVAAGAVRFGSEGKAVDNFHAGGMAMILDVSTGKTVTDGYDIERKTYEKAPVLGTKLKGFQVPQWEAVKNLVIEAAKVTPSVRYVGWDVCISKQYGPCLIEGNPYPGQDVTQYWELNLGTYDAYMKILER